MDEELAEEIAATWLRRMNAEHDAGKAAAVVLDQLPPAAHVAVADDGRLVAYASDRLYVLSGEVDRGDYDHLRAIHTRVLDLRAVSLDLASTRTYERRTTHSVQKTESWTLACGAIEGGPLTFDTGALGAGDLWRALSGLPNA